MTPNISAPTDRVLLHREGGIAALTINRPGAHNALDVPTAHAFHAACRALRESADVRGVVLLGAGRSFGVGGDLSALRADAAAVAPQLMMPCTPRCRSWRRSTRR